MPRNPRRTTITKAAARAERTAAILATAPPALIGPPAGGKAGRPRTGNKAADYIKQRDGTIEVGQHHAALDRAFNGFLEGIDEQELHNALALSPNKRHHGILIALTHPKNRKRYRMGTGLPGEYSIAAQLKGYGMTLNDLMEVYGRYRTSQAVRIAMDRSPTIIKHTADDAENRQVVCPRCDGIGTLDLGEVQDELRGSRARAKVRTCPECKGEGEVTQSGDMEARKLVLEVAGIAGKRGPSVDARTVNLNGGTFSVESFIRNVEAIEGNVDAGVDSQPESDIIDLE